MELLKNFLLPVLRGVPNLETLFFRQDGCHRKKMARKFIVTLVSSFQRKKNDGPLVPYNKVNQLVSDALGLTSKTVESVTKGKYRQNGNEINVLRSPGKKRTRKFLATGDHLIDPQAI